MYKLSNENWVLKYPDTKFSVVDTPEDPNTSQHYIEYKKWLATGGVPEPADPPPTEQIRENAKAVRAEAVRNIKVTTAAGNTFDGDEVSQGRMARAIVALQGTGVPTVNWVLADNTVVDATAAELIEALLLAGAAQAAIWVLQ